MVLVLIIIVLFTMCQGVVNKWNQIPKGILQWNYPFNTTTIYINETESRG